LNFCTGPEAPEGTMMYNETSHVVQFCNGSRWVAMGPPGDGGAGCANPDGDAGHMVYNTTSSVMQYCEGDAWVGIGKQISGSGGPFMP